MEVHCTLCVALLDIDDKATRRMPTYNQTFAMLSINKSPLSGLKGHWTRGPARRSGAHRKWPVCVNTIIMFITVRAPTAVAPRAHVGDSSGYMIWRGKGSTRKVLPIPSKTVPKVALVRRNMQKQCNYRCVQYSICIICINLFCMRNYVQISSQIDNCNMTWPRSRTCHTSCPWNCQKIHASVSFQVVEIQRTDCPTESYPVTKEPTWTCWQHLLVAQMLENHHLRFAPGVLVKSVSVSMVHLDATWCH